MEGGGHGDEERTGGPLRHYAPKNAPSSPYARVKVTGEKGKRHDAALVEEDSIDGSFEFLTMPGKASPTREKEGTYAPEVTGRAASKPVQKPPSSPRAGKPTRLAPEPPTVKAEPADDNLYEPMEIGRPLGRFSSTSPAPSPPPGHRNPQLQSKTMEVRNLPDAGSLDDSFEYEALGDVLKHVPSPLAAQPDAQQQSERQQQNSTIRGRAATGGSGKDNSTMVMNSLYEHVDVRPPASKAGGGDSSSGGDMDTLGTVVNLPDGAGDILEESFEYQPIQVIAGATGSTLRPLASKSTGKKAPPRPTQPPQRRGISPPPPAEDYLIPSEVGTADLSGAELTPSLASTAYAYAKHERRYTAGSTDTAQSIAPPLTSPDSSYVVSDKEWLHFSRRGPKGGGGRGRATDPHGRPPLPIPGDGSGSDPGHGSSYLDDEDDRDRSRTVGGVRSATLRSEGGSVYQPLVMPEHFLPSTTYYERLMDVTVQNRKHRMAMLPPIDPSLSEKEQYRHRIVQHLLETEESYIKTLKLLLDTYAPAIADLPSRTGLVLLVDKMRAFFDTLQKIFSLHHMFKIGLSGPVSDWNAKQKIGTVFEGAFSKAMAVEVYSEYIEMFSSVLTAIQNGRRTQRLFAEVLRCCDKENGLRMNLESLMLRPVQRFPQFLLILQDLLGHTEKDHPDRVPLQLALTRIENVTEQLNRRKRLSDQLTLVERLRGRIMNLPLDMPEKARLICQDEVCQVKVKHGKAYWKKRCLFLFCNQLVCTSVLRPTSPFSRDPSDYSYKFRWRKRVEDVSIIASDLDLDTASAKVVSSHFKSGTSEDTAFPRADGGDLALQLRHERATLLYDMKMITKIAALVATLRQERPPMTMAAVQGASQGIQRRLTIVEEQLRRCEAYRLDIGIPESGTSSSVQHMSFIMSSPSARCGWVKAFNRAKLMREAADKPSWLHCSDEDSKSAAEHAMVCSLESPLLMHKVPVMLTRDSMTLELGVEVSVPNTLEGMVQYAPPYVWICSNGGAQAAQISIIAGINVDPVIVECFQCIQSRVLSMMFVPGADTTLLPQRSGTETKEDRSTVWLGTQSKTILVFKAGMSDSRMPSTQLKCVDSVLSLEYYNEHRFAGLADGSVVLFFKNAGGQWDSNSCSRIVLTSDPVTCSAVFGEEIFLAGGREIHVVSTVSKTIVNTFASTESEDKRREVQAVHGMLGLGTGLWLFHRHSAVIKLLHAETKEYIQEFDIQSTVRRQQKDLGLSDRAIDRMYVTKMEHSPGQLWVGTSCGVVVLLPVPKLGGVPRVMGSALISHHGNGGPVRIIIPVTSQVELSINDESVEFPGDKRDSSPASLTTLSPEPSSSAPPPLPRDPDNAVAYDKAEGGETMKSSSTGPRGAASEPLYTNSESYEEEYVPDAALEDFRSASLAARGAGVAEGKEPVYEMAGKPDFSAASGQPEYSRLGSSPSSEMSSLSLQRQTEESIYASLFEHSEPIDPAAAIEERRRNSKHKRGMNKVVVEQQYIVCGGIGYAYNIATALAAKAGEPHEDGGQLLVWELHDG